MNKPTDEQQESLRDADARLGLPPAPQQAPQGEEQPDMAADRLTPREATEAITDALEGTGITPQLLQENPAPAAAQRAVPPVQRMEAAAPVYARPVTRPAVVAPASTSYVDPGAGELRSEDLPGWVR